MWAHDAQTNFFNHSNKKYDWDRELIFILCRVSIFNDMGTQSRNHGIYDKKYTSTSMGTFFLLISLIAIV